MLNNVECASIAAKAIRERYSARYGKDFLKTHRKDVGITEGMHRNKEYGMSVVVFTKEPEETVVDMPDGGIRIRRDIKPEIYVVARVNSKTGEVILLDERLPDLDTVEFDD